MFAKALAHFKKADPVIYKLFNKTEPFALAKSEDHFADLCEAIIGQQLSTKAASTITERFKALFPRKKATPKKVLEMASEEIRSCGISNSKVSFIKDLAAHVLADKLIFDEFHKLSDDDIKTKLKAVKGIGDWTVEMFLMFTLGREDVFSYGDLGLRKAVQKLYNLKELPDKRMLEFITNKWAPYRTYAARVLWMQLDNG